MENNKGYHKLILWQKGKEFVKLLYQKTELFPKSEVLGLESQIRRAIVSFLLNLIEGQRRNSQKEFLKFLNISESSLVEVEACLEIALELEFISNKDYGLLESKRKELAAMLQSFIKKIKQAV